MSKVKIQTLTPVHIGSGEFLKNNSDFVVHKEGNDSFISIISPKKILDLIGVDHINDWVSLIERKGDTKEYVSKIAKNATPRSYAVRTLANYASSIKKDDTLKECIHDGMGRAYIPGSSIKGAIRTAVLATMANGINGLENLVINQRKIVSAKQVEAKLFGGDPNSDVFRFVKIGDAYFGKGCELSTRVVNLNIREKKELKDTSKPQLVEAIGVDWESEFQMKVDSANYNWVRNHWAFDNPKIRPLGSLPEQIRSISSLFELINEHTGKLVKDEIKYWKEVVNAGYVGAEEYIENMDLILDEVKSCKEGQECVLRIGHASGWRFMTGAWSENLDNFDRDIVPSARPKNYNYQQYDFPKSRRLDEDCDIFGFVKLSIL